MDKKRRKFAGWLLLVCLMFCPAATRAADNSKLLMVYYMPWYVSKPYSGNWGWHWTMDHFNPDEVNASGEREIASWYYPLIGPYDSADPAVLEYHVLLMKLTGVDGVIVDWYGMDNYLDYAVNEQRTAALFNWARKAGLKFSLCYEDQTIQREVTGGFIAPGDAVAHAQRTMMYVETNYCRDGSFLRWSNQPVLLNFGPQYFKSNEQWQAIFSVLNASNQPAFFTEDSRLPAGVGAFDWPPMWLSQVPGTGGVLSGAALDNYLSTFEQNGRPWPASISSAFPRFHDIYQKAGVRDYWGYLGDRNGETLRETLKRALTGHSPFVQIVTWNDFGEGTIVEPTREYGYRDLGIIQDYRREYLNANFSYRTNDLVLATRLYHLRTRPTNDAHSTSELDGIFTNIIAGDLDTANSRLSRLESGAAEAHDSRVSRE